MGGPAGRVLLAGWFSFLHGEATAGDLDALATVREWLDARHIAYDVAWSPAFGGPEADDVDPGGYTALVFTCGPLAGAPVERLARRFAHCRKVAVGVSAVDPAVATLFEVVVARDGAGGKGLPDLAWSAAGGHGARGAWPVVALATVGEQPEYGERARHGAVHRALRRFLEHRDLAVVDVDTRVDPGVARQRVPAQVHGLLAAADVAVTTRLHGLVLGLRFGTPVLAVDPVEGGAKVSRQAAAVGWPAVLTPDELSERTLGRWLDFCLGPDAATAVERARRRAEAGLGAVAGQLFDGLPGGR